MTITRSKAKGGKGLSIQLFETVTVKTTTNVTNKEKDDNNEHNDGLIALR